MPQINQLSSLDSLSGGDQLPVYSASNGDARKSSITLLTQYVAENMGNVSLNYLVTLPMAVSELPAASVAGAGARAAVLDSDQTLTDGIGVAVAGGGAHVVPVFSNGSSWLIG